VQISGFAEILAQLVTRILARILARILTQILIIAGAVRQVELRPLTQVLEQCE
jgi:hypothetical protein